MGHLEIALLFVQFSFYQRNENKWTCHAQVEIVLLKSSYTLFYSYNCAHGYKVVEENYGFSKMRSRAHFKCWFKALHWKVEVRSFTVYFKSAALSYV